jgi:hypothetical protein
LTSAAPITGGRQDGISPPRADKVEAHAARQINEKTCRCGRFLFALVLIMFTDP